MKILFIGDPHITPNEIEDGEALIRLVQEVANSEKVDEICFLGDQYHTHSILHLSVMAFWERSFETLSRYCGAKHIRCLVGNHDKSGVKGVRDNAMLFHRNISVTVNQSIPSDIDIMYIGYQDDPAEFVRLCNEYPTKTVICHQTFAGSMFENGYVTPDGVEPLDIPQETVISGHIHKPQRNGKVHYVGAPRWRTASDANVDRAIWVMEFDFKGRLVNSKAFDTSKHCKPLYALTDSPANPIELPGGHATIMVDVYGPADYVAKRKVFFEAAGARVRTFPESTRIARVKESDGMPRAMKKFLAEFNAKNGTPPENLWKMASERISWLK